MIKYIPFILIIIIGCKHDEISFAEATKISGNDDASCAFFTRNHKGNPVLCWTEGKENEGKLYFSIYNIDEERFGTPQLVSPSNGTGPHPESMNKLAFKEDGTIVAVYERKHPTTANKYAGSICYTQSFDNGKSWTQERYIHSDTLRDNSRGFFDIALLPDGEIGAVWLDSRLKLGKEGSSLFFSKTRGKEGFQQDYQVGETVCECCRTDLYVDDEKNVHIVYRDIETTLEGQIRDFSHAVSSDNGGTFSHANKVSNDKWMVEGCPHTGASMCSAQGKLSVAWFTAGGESGLYFTTSHDNGHTFEQRQFVSANAKHPQVVSNDMFTLAVWDESAAQGSHHHGGGHEEHQKTEGMVFAKLSDENNASVTVPGTEGAEFPVIINLSKGHALVAYTMNNIVYVKKASF